MSLKQLPTESMPREKLLQRGPQCLQGAVLSPQRVGRSQICSITSGIGDDAALSR
ncbi:DNA repair protein RadC [Vibrio cholerae]|nr:DNA repair protein RadC [Vibrio cholerae]